jgi:hypothetical protein
VATHKKKYEIIKATTRDISGIGVKGKKDMMFKQGRVLTEDAGLANAIEERFGARKGSGEVTVTEVPNFKVEAGHTYSFAMPEWKPRKKPKKAKKHEGDWVEVRPGRWVLKRPKKEDE